MGRLDATQTYAIPASPATEDGTRKHLAVEQYDYPAPNQPGHRSIAYVWSHANGFHKEMLHPLMHRFLIQLRLWPQFQSTHVTFYAFDARHHGDSALLNAGHGQHRSNYSVMDHAMDTVQVISELKLKENHDMVIGFGHSFGASAMMIAEFWHPKVFDGFCLVEPILTENVEPFTPRTHAPPPHLALTLKRRDCWPNREVCLKSLVTRPFWKAFHPEVLENYVYGLYDAPDGTVKLKCPKEEEYHIFISSQYGATLAYKSLQSVTIPAHMVHADGSTFTDPSLVSAIQKLSSNITISILTGSHMVVGEKPDSLVPEMMYLTERVLAHHAKL